MDTFRAFAKKSTALFLTAAGLVAIANVDILGRDRDEAGGEARRLETRRTFEARLAPPEAKPAASRSRTSLRAALRESLGGVELGPENPFAQLRDLKPLESILARGVVHFTRRSFRSPQYRDESGYDLVSFEIEHEDQTRSTLVAYLERPLEGPDVVPVVLLVNNGPEMAREALFRGGELTERRSVPLSVAQTMVRQRLDAGVPFLSVSR